MRTRSEFKRDIETGEIGRSSPVRVYALPKGVLYTLKAVGNNGVSCLIAGPKEVIGSELGDTLLRLGVRGRILIAHTTRGLALAKWLGFQENLTSAEFGNFKIYTFEDFEETVHPFAEMSKIPSIVIGADEVFSEIDRMSADLSFDGFLVETAVNQYRILPQRYETGVILGVYCRNNKPGVAVIQIKHRQLRITRLPFWIQGLSCEELPKLRGRTCKIQYTSAITGDHLSSYSSAIIKHVSR